ncbi:MAG: 1-acyl-sn-glycerol-3-phosphate acyltransferase, partial [Stackebrandtia sp.]
HNFPVHIRIGEPLGAAGPVEETTAQLRARMSELLTTAQEDYPMPAGQPWVPARLGGTAPTLEQAAVLEAEEYARRRTPRP